MQRYPVKPVVKVFGKKDRAHPIPADIQAVRLISIVKQKNVFIMRTANVRPDISVWEEAVRHVTARRQNVQVSAADSIDLSIRSWEKPQKKSFVRTICRKRA